MHPSAVQFKQHQAHGDHAPNAMQGMPEVPGVLAI